MGPLRPPGTTPLLVLLAAALLGAPSVVRAADDGDKAKPRIVAFGAEAIPTGARVSFVLDNAFDEKIREKLGSGLEITFQHRVEVRRRRTLWFARTLAEKNVFTTAVWNAVTRQYSLAYKVNGGTVRTLTTSDEGEMIAFMTRIEGIELIWPPGEQGSEGKTEIRARSHLETRFFVLFPYAYETDWVEYPLPTAAATPRKEP